MKHLIEGIGALLAVLAWLGGAVLAQGFWSTAFALVMPLWAWYLVAERAIQALGWV
jgi:hypothetical protein